jgi:hypothetical protein
MLISFRVSFGDSFSAGPGAGHYLDSITSGCLRSNNSYPMQLNKKLQGLVPNSQCQRFWSGDPV